MKALFIFITAGLLLLPAAARAQEPVPYTALPQAGQPPSASAAGRTSISDGQTKAFYDSCSSKDDPRMSRESIEAMCSCSAKQMQKTMSVEDIQTMKGNDQAGRDMLNHMLLEVYAPCMNFPLQDLLESQCLQDTKDKPLPPGMDLKQVCHCMAAKTGAWFTSNGRDLMAQVLKANPDITDPVGPVMDDAAFQKASSENLSSCLSGGDKP